jgi:hypothetical protein
VRADLDGANPTPPTILQLGAEYIALDAKYVYFTSSLANGGMVGRIAKP